MGELDPSHPDCQVLRTSAMLQHIPTEYTREDVLELIDRQGFAGLYDFVYVPISFQTELNHGYAFINLTTSENAERFQTHFDGFSDWRIPSDQVCEVAWSEQFQGIDSLVERYRNSPMMHDMVDDRFRPALFKEGERIGFPEPTKKVRPPRGARKVFPIETHGSPITSGGVA